MAWNFWNVLLNPFPCWFVNFFVFFFLATAAAVSWPAVRAVAVVDVIKQLATDVFAAEFDAVGVQAGPIRDSRSFSNGFHGIYCEPVAGVFSVVSLVDEVSAVIFVVDWIAREVFVIESDFDTLLRQPEEIEVNLKAASDVVTLLFAIEVSATVPSSVEQLAGEDSATVTVAVDVHSDSSLPSIWKRSSPRFTIARASAASCLGVRLLNVPSSSSPLSSSLQFGSVGRVMKMSARVKSSSSSIAST